MSSKITRWRNANPQKWIKQREAYKEKRNRNRREQYAAMSPTDRININAKRGERRRHDPLSKEKSAKYQRLNVLRKCGMSLQEARKWYSKVNKICSICGSKENLGIDHDHDKKMIRGLLCRRCNLGLGHLKDDKKLVRNALRYLESHSLIGRVK